MGAPAFAIGQQSQYHASNLKGYPDADPVSAAGLVHIASLTQQVQSNAAAMARMQVTEVVEEETTMCLRDQLISRRAEDG